jgi:hypothetical protein
LDDAFIIVIENKKIIPRLTVPIKTPISKEMAGNIHTRLKAPPTLIAKNRDNANKKNNYYYKKFQHICL